MGERDDNSPLDWLPAGWKMEVKARKTGRKDKYYIDPSNGQRFSSKPEVLRYLKNKENNHPLCEESKEGSSTDGSPVKFVDKEAVSEGLPAGWIKKVRVTRNGDRIRKDPYYIDPISGHHFRSLKEVSRYLVSGKLDSQNKGRHASKPKEKDPLKSGAGGHALPSTAEPRKLRSWSNRKVQKLVPEKQNLNSALATNNRALPKLNKLNPCKEKEKSSENLSPVVANLAEKIQKDNGVETQEDILVEKMQTDKMVELQEDIPAEKTQTDKRVDMQKDIPPAKIETDKGVEAQEDIQAEMLQTDKRIETQEDIQAASIKKKKRVKRESDLPRRKSKRLAGVEVELPLVLELPARVRQAASRPTGEDQTRCGSNCKSLDNSVEQVKRVKTGDTACKVEGVANLTPGEAALPEVKANLGVSDVPARDHTSRAVVDAIREKQQDVADVLLEKHPEQGLADAVPKQHAEQGVADVLPKEQAEQEVTDDLPEKHVKQGVAQCEGHEESETALVSSLGGLWNDPCIEFAIKTLTGDLPVGNDEKVTDNSGPSVKVLDAGSSSCHDLPFGELWADPCFEFAVKTLTGDIPTVDAVHFQTAFQQQHWSSKAGESNGVRLSNYRAAEFNQAHGAYR